VILELSLRLGHELPAILALTFFKYPLQATGWWLVLPPALRPPWWRCVQATFGGEAVGFVTLAGTLTAEPMRAAIMKPFLPIATSVAAGLVERSVYAATGTLVIAASLFVAASRFGRDSWGPAVAALLVAAVPVVVVLLARRQGSWGTAGDPAGWRAVLRGLWFERRPTLHVIALACLAQHAIMIGEAYLMLRAAGAAPTVATVLMFEGVSKVANSIGAIAPGRLGLAEGSSALVAGTLGLGAGFGVSLVLMRRVRSLLWSVAGITLVLPDLWRVSRSPEAAARHVSNRPACGDRAPQPDSPGRNDCANARTVHTSTLSGGAPPDDGGAN
jgi:hypothetical protein